MPMFSHPIKIELATDTRDIPQSARDAVDRGIALLDEKDPEWRARLKEGIKDLLMVSMISCVLGILYGDYEIGVRKLGISSHGDACQYGFDIIGYSQHGFMDLQRLWEESVA